jgi:hypothetical protein
VLYIPNYDRHLSQGAKQRALTARRVANHKGKKNAEGNAPSVTEVTHRALPVRYLEEEKEKSINTHSHTAHARPESGGGVEIPPWEHVAAYAVTIGLAEWRAKDEFEKLEANGWTDAKGNPIRKWQAHFSRVKTWWEADGRPTSPKPLRAANGSHRETAAERDLRVSGTNYADKPLKML